MKDKDRIEAFKAVKDNIIAKVDRYNSNLPLSKTEYMRQYRALNNEKTKEKNNKHNKAYRDNNKDKIKERNAIYYQKKKALKLS